MSYISAQWVTTITDEIVETESRAELQGILEAFVMRESALIFT
jgi:hypothetical protein